MVKESVREKLYWNMRCTCQQVGRMHEGSNENIGLLMEEVVKS